MSQVKEFLIKILVHIEVDCYLFLFNIYFYKLTTSWVFIFTTTVFRYIIVLTMDILLRFHILRMRKFLNLHVISRISWWILNIWSSKSRIRIFPFLWFLSYIWLFWVWKAWFRFFSDMRNHRLLSRIWRLFKIYLIKPWWLFYKVKLYSRWSFNHISLRCFATNVLWLMWRILFLKNLFEFDLIIILVLKFLFSIISLSNKLCLKLPLIFIFRKFVSFS